MESVPVHTMCISFSGEVGPVFSQGSRTIILRFAGCNMSCSYCDTPDTQKVGGNIKGMSVQEISDALLDLSNATGISNVLVTGGEPLLYEQCIIDLVEQLPGMKFQIETNGSIFPKLYHSFLAKDLLCQKRVGFVVDIKSHVFVEMSYIDSMEQWFDYAIRYSNRVYFKISFGLSGEGLYTDAGRLSAMIMCTNSLAISASEKNSPLDTGNISIFVSPIFGKDNTVKADLLSLISQQVNTEKVPSFVNIGVNLQLHKILSMP